MGRSETTGKRSKVREIAAATIRLDLILAPGGKPLTGETTEEREVIRARVAQLGAWRLAHPAYFGPAHSAHRGVIRGRGGPTARARPGDSRRDGPGSPAAADR
jgi:hypothetical protein